MNIDANGNQLTMDDCLYLTARQQALAGFPTATQTFLDTLDPGVAISYNPNLDFYVGSSTAVIDSQDAVYCINYVLKRWRFVYNVSLACRPLESGGGAQLSVELAGGKVGSFDQAEYFVEAPALGTTVVATVLQACPGMPANTSSLNLVAAGATGGVAVTRLFRCVEN